ncbi:MAG TPA: copper resistance protein CopC [Ktedonobacterales bacterium]|nr:copper resistance protein CopC [Ktedonobacterales bacterium]
MRAERSFSAVRHPLARILLAVCCGIALALLAFSPASHMLPVASAHAVLVRSDPPADAILNAPPSHVTLWFSEDINPLTSRAVVVDTANREVDNRDAHVSDNDSKELAVTLPLLKAGTYVVIWRSQSADDGHVSGGSFIFRIAAPDGSVPPVPAVLPTGNIPGGGGIGDASSSGLDAPSIVQAVFNWLALLAMVFWVGGIIWETWILPSTLTHDSALTEAALAAEQRFRRLAPFALIAVLVADIGIILAQSAELAGDFTGAISPPLLRAVLFGSRFGTFWWMRELVALAALILTLAATTRSLPLGRQRSGSTLTETSADEGGIVSWGHELLTTLRGIPRLPWRLVAGLRARTPLGAVMVLLAGALIVAFALSGHAAAVPTNELAYALAVDIFHLVCNAAWVGGLLYISLVFVPALAGLDVRTRARVLAMGLPEFGAVAILSAFLLAATGTLNSTIHMTSIEQFLTTAYGRTLFVKIELFLLMVGISAWHAFRIRPRLAYILNKQDTLALAGNPVAVPAVTVNSVTTSTTGARAPERNGDHMDNHGGVNLLLRDLAVKLEDWLRREAMLGAAVLLCAALLGVFAGTLVAAPAPTGTSTAPSGPFLATQQAGGYAITLNVVPAKFGNNTFTVTVKDSKGQPVTNAIVVVTTVMLDMDMGEQSVALKPVGASQPGVYSGQGDLTMGGHWKLIVKVVPPGAPQPLTPDFRLTIGYS